MDKPAPRAWRQLSANTWRSYRGGLRRGFIQAGAQNLLMTLWPISDRTTVQIMLDFYDAAEKTHNAPQALADTQRDWLVGLRKERGLLPAVQLAGAFIMSSQGKQ